MITDMGFPEWEIKKIIHDYRRMRKACELIADGSEPPFEYVMIVIERLLPAFAAIDWKDNDDRYYDLIDIVLSDLPDDEVESVLLMQ